MSWTTITVLEQTIPANSVEVEDGGMAKILNVTRGADGTMNEDGLYARLISYIDNDDPNVPLDHVDFDKLIGKTIRVTIEIED